VSVLPDGAGAASEADRHTRGTGVITPLKDVPARNWRMWAGGGAYLAPHGRPGNSRKVKEAGREATGKGYGVPVAMPLGIVGCSPLSDQTSEHGNCPGSRLCVACPTRYGLSPPSADRPGTGRSRRSSPSAGKPCTWRRAAADSRGEEAAMLQEAPPNGGAPLPDGRRSAGAGSGDAGQASLLGGGRCRPQVRRPVQLCGRTRRRCWWRSTGWRVISEPVPLAWMA